MNGYDVGTGIALGGLVVFSGFIIGLASCTNTPKPQQDLPDEKVEANIGERLVYINPDKFPNVVAFCDGTTRIYVTTRDTQNFQVVPDHPSCTGGEPGG